MTLITCFNIFQKVAKRLKLSANARSLYIAILGEFNSERYPETLNLSNRLLQDISGVNSDSSFHSARNALINTKLIHHKKQFYTLTPNEALEKLYKRFGGTLETPCSHIGDSLETAWRQLGDGLEFSNTSLSSDEQNIEKEKEIEKERDTTTTTDSARARASLNTNSPEVLKAWEDAKGEKLAGFKAQGLILDERNYGTEKVIATIKTASESNDYNEYPYVTYRYFKVVLENQVKGGKSNDRTTEQNDRTDSVTANYRIDICPDD